MHLRFSLEGKFAFACALLLSAAIVTTAGLFLWLDSVAIAVFTGVTAGFFPAMRAANLPPIDALRSE